MGKTTTPTATHSSCCWDCYSVSEIFTLLVSVTPTTAAATQAATLSTRSTRSLLSLSQSHLPQLLPHRLLHCPPDLYSPCLHHIYNSCWHTGCYTVHQIFTCLSHTYHSHCCTDCYTVHQIFTLLVTVKPTTVTATQTVILSTRTLLSLFLSHLPQSLPHRLLRFPPELYSPCFSQTYHSHCRTDCYTVHQIFTLLVSVKPTTVTATQTVILSTRTLLSLFLSHLPQSLPHRLLRFPPELYSPCFSQTYHSHCRTDCYTVHQVFTLLVSVTPTTVTAAQTVTLSTRSLLSLSQSHLPQLLPHRLLHCPPGLYSPCLTQWLCTFSQSWQAQEWTGGHKLMVDLPSRLTLLYIYI